MARKNGAKICRQKMARKKWREISSFGGKKCREISKVLAGKLKLFFIVGGKFILIFRLETNFFISVIWKKHRYLKKNRLLKVAIFQFVDISSSRSR